MFYEIGSIEAIDEQNQQHEPHEIGHLDLEALVALRINIFDKPIINHHDIVRLSSSAL
jgi:hypothetical protein